jgi:tRNA (guanine6-N2)-methyltransferase
VTAGVELMARTIRGIEWVAAAEISALGDADVFAVEHRLVRFDVDSVRPDLLRLGTVDDLFLVVGGFAGVDNRRASLPLVTAETARWDMLAALPIIAQVREVPEPPSFDVVGTFLGRRNFNRYELEDAVGLAVERQTGWRYESRAGGDRKPPPTPLSIRVHLSGDSALLGVRLGEHPLHRRPYRTRSRTGSLHPPLSRALVLLAGLRAGATLVDPFCGAGTIPIEAALGIEGVSARGFDVEDGVVALARQNAADAGVSADFETADAAALPLADGSVDRIATNPPWGQAVPAAEAGGRPWREIGRVLAADGRAAILGPPDLVADWTAALELEAVLRNGVSLFGQHVEIALVSADRTQFDERDVLADILPDACGVFADGGPGADAARTLRPCA